MVYLVCQRLSPHNWGTGRPILDRLAALKLNPIQLSSDVFVIESDEPAAVLYMQLVPAIDATSDRLIVAEVAANFAGTFLNQGRANPDEELAIARTFGRASSASA